MSCEQRQFGFTALCILILAWWPAPAAAQNGPDPDRALNLSQPDFSIVTLPTTLRVPRFKGAFRVTHRFGRPLGAGDFGSLVEDAFGLDAGAQVGLEYRFGLAPGVQVGIHRTSDRTIGFFGQYNVVQQGDGNGIGVGILASVDGANNFRDRYSPAFGAVISHEFGDAGTVYVEPVWVGNSNLLLDELAGEDNTFMVGLGARLRVRPTVYLVGEFIPRTGYAPGVSHATFGLEKRAGGHSFQVNFSNGFGTTMGQLARGGTRSEDWYLGFNISRKLY